MAGRDKRFGIRREPGPQREIGLPSARSCRYVPPAFRNMHATKAPVAQLDRAPDYESGGWEFESLRARHLHICLLYTSDAADDLLCVDLGGRRIIKKKNKQST